MTTTCIGIDEAGYGPTLGPLSIVAVAASAESHEQVRAAFVGAAVTVTDSKKLHKPGKLRPLEQVALAAVSWACGFEPGNAAELFALLGEQPEARSCPWMAGAEELRLPTVGAMPEAWNLPGITPGGLGGALIHPAEINEASTAGVNKAGLELDHIGRLVQAHPGPVDLVCDRLGGRRYYQDALQEWWPEHMVLIDEEDRGRSRYHSEGPGAESGNRAAFLVNGESASPLVAAASCIAKYARELHMLLFNSYWSGRFRWLEATAGYPQDAKRWCFQIGAGNRGAYGHELIRGWKPDTDTDL
jgi:ribonuclease HII